jgi:hypothetical protein
MKQKLWLTLVTCLAYCIDNELYKAIDYLREQVRVRCSLPRSMKIEPKHMIDDMAEIVCIERLSRLLKSYHRLAA